MKNINPYTNELSSLLHFLDDSPCSFLAVKNVKDALISSGFTELDRRKAWDIERGGRYFTISNSSAIIAFVVGEGSPHDGFRIISAHSDSPGFRVKPNPLMRGEKGWSKLNTEVYGGPILYTWFDRPLSLAGRVILRSGDLLSPRQATVRIDRPILTIPHLAIHFNRSVNEGNPLSKQNDMLPVLGQIASELPGTDILTKMIADSLETETTDILDYDLMLYDTTPAGCVGLDNEMICSGRLDDLSMVHAALTAITAVEGAPMQQTRIMAIFDNEETGSGTKQGAASPLLNGIMQRIVAALGGNGESYLRAIANSFMVSADNAHGLHPNYPSKHDPTNHPVLGGGPVIKINANCKYMTDADSAAVFAEICRKADVPFQTFVNHSDIAGGSTLGNILTRQIDLRGVDMGAALWAMHSVRETASTADHRYVIEAFKTFFRD